MKKRGITLALFLCVLLAGCGGENVSSYTEEEEEYLESFDETDDESPFEDNDGIRMSSGEALYVGDNHIYNLGNENGHMVITMYDENVEYIGSWDVPFIDELTGRVNEWMVYDKQLIIASENYIFQYELGSDDNYTIITDEAVIDNDIKLVCSGDSLYFVEFTFDVVSGKDNAYLYSYNLLSGEKIGVVYIGEYDDNENLELGEVYYADRFGNILVKFHSTTGFSKGVVVVDMYSGTIIQDTIWLSEEDEYDYSENLTGFMEERGNYHESGTEFDGGTLYYVNGYEADKYGCQPGLYCLEGNDYSEEELYEENAINNEAMRFVFRNVIVKGVTKNGKVIFWDDSLYLLDIMTGEVEELDIDY